MRAICTAVVILALAISSRAAGAQSSTTPIGVLAPVSARDGVCTLPLAPGNALRLEIRRPGEGSRVIAVTFDSARTVADYLELITLADVAGTAETNRHYTVHLERIAAGTYRGSVGYSAEEGQGRVRAADGPLRGAQIDTAKAIAAELLKSCGK